MASSAEMPAGGSRPARSFSLCSLSAEFEAKGKKFSGRKVLGPTILKAARYRFAFSSRAFRKSWQDVKRVPL